MLRRLAKITFAMLSIISVTGSANVAIALDSSGVAVDVLNKNLSSDTETGIKLLKMLKFLKKLLGEKLTQQIIAGWALINSCIYCWDATNRVAGKIACEICGLTKSLYFLY